jgi:carbon storage regulator
MLVLTRRSGEEIVIGGDIRVMVLSVKGKRVCLGITAPSSLPVLRLEVLEESFNGEGSPTLARHLKNPATNDTHEGRSPFGSPAGGGEGQKTATEAADRGAIALAEQNLERTA